MYLKLKIMIMDKKTIKKETLKEIKDFVELSKRMCDVFVRSGYDKEVKEIFELYNKYSKSELIKVIVAEFLSKVISNLKGF
jgi:hypothetical protein